MIEYTIQDFIKDVNILSFQIVTSKKNYSGIYPIPCGGVPLGIALSQQLKIPLVESPDTNTLIVDDIVDTGATRKEYDEFDFACIHVSRKASPPTFFAHQTDGWVHYWWEKNETTIENNIVRILRFIGEDPTRIGLKDTPSRVVKMYQEIFRGYDIKQKPTITCFPNGEDGIIYNEMLVDQGYFFSHCEHHMVPFFGDYYYAYIPGKLVIGASKIARIIDYYSARLQVAERLVSQVVTEIETEVEPLGQILVMKARHLCKEMRGIKKHNSPFTAIAVRGYFAENRNGCKDEFMSQCNI